MKIGSSFANENQLKFNSNESENLLKKLATARRINSAADDAAGLMIANRLTQSVNASAQGTQNVYDGISLATVADQGLQGITDNLDEMRRLAVQAGNGILSASDRQALQKQADAYAANIQDQIKNTEFAGIKLFDQDGAIQVGTGHGNIAIQTQDLSSRLTDSGAFSIDLSSAEAAQASLKSIQDSAAQVDNNRTDLGATINALQSTARNLQTRNVNEQEAVSRIQDLDYAKAVTEQVAAGIREQASIAVIGQGRISEQQALKLLA
jgi:flagellin